jgi:acyl-CoA dehydrogenase
MVGIQTTAKKEGDYYIVNGRKSMIARNTVTDVFAITARTGEKDRDISTMLVEANIPGFQRGRTENLITKSRTSPVGEFIMTDCRVPVENRVGPENRGRRPMLEAINGGGRMGGAGICLGTSQAALELGTKYAKERHLYGKPLTDLQTMLFWIGDMEVRTQRARLLCYYAAWLLDQGKRSDEIRAEIAMGKLEASEAALNNCIKAIEIHGAYGTTPEFGVIQKYRTALDMIAAAGSNQISRLIISNATVDKY